MEQERGVSRRTFLKVIGAGTIASLGFPPGCSSLLPEIPGGSDSSSETTPTTEITPTPAVEKTPVIITPQSTTPPRHVPSPTSSPTSIPTVSSTPEITRKEVFLSLWEKETYQAINELRGASALPFLSLSAPLVEIARERSQDMATRNYFSHTTPEGSMVFDLLRQEGLPPFGGEILFRTNDEKLQPKELADKAMEEFLESPKHQPILLRAEYSLVGIGFDVSKDNFKILTIIFSPPY